MAMSDPEGWVHPNSGDLYTPVGSQFYALLDQLHREYGSWRMVAIKTELRPRQIQYFRHGKRKAISMRVLDRIITASGVGNLQDFTFFTAEDLVKLGIWKEVSYRVGQYRVQGGVITEASKMSRLERERLGRKKRRARKSLAKKKLKAKLKKEAAFMESLTSDKRRGIYFYGGRFRG